MRVNYLTRGLGSLFCLAFSAGVFASGFTESSDANSAKHFTFMYGKAGFHAVQADLSSDTVCASTHYSPRLTNVWKMISQAQPIAAVTGTFFAFENQKPVADVIVDGQRKATGYRGSVLAVDWFGKVSIENAAVKKPFDYLTYRYALRGGVRVIDKGKIAPNPRAQGFTDSGIWGSAARAAVGITKSGKVLLVATKNPVTLSTLGKAMATQGAVDAVSLDGGGSTMLYFDGDIKIQPNRPLSTLFMIERRNPYDNLFRTHLEQIADNQSRGAIQGVLQGTIKTQR